VEERTWGGSSDHLRVHKRTGVYVRATGTFKEAENLFREILELAKATFEVEDPFTLNGLFDLALAIIAQGRVQDARELWKPFTETGKRILVESASASTILGNPALSGEDEILTRPKSGIETAESLLRSIRKIPPENQSEGVNHWLRLSNQETRAHLVQAEDEGGFKDLEMGFGEFAITVDSINAQASVYIRQGRWKKAVQYLLFMLDMHEKVLGSEHADTLAIISKLASLYET